MRVNNLAYPVRGSIDMGVCRKVDERLPGKENSNSCGERPVHLIIKMINGIRTSRLSIEKSLSLLGGNSLAGGGN